jgi:hypothetical protein
MDTFDRQLWRAVRGRASSVEDGPRGRTTGERAVGRRLLPAAKLGRFARVSEHVPVNANATPTRNANPTGTGQPHKHLQSLHERRVVGA